jgi:hypothetical protein
MEAIQNTSKESEWSSRGIEFAPFYDFSILAFDLMI